MTGQKRATIRQGLGVPRAQDPALTFHAQLHYTAYL